MLGEVLFVVLQLTIDIFGQLLLELGLSGVKEALGRQNRNPLLATVGYLLLGLALGWLTVMMFPEPIFRKGPFPGMSLPIAFMAGGTAMHLWGRYRRTHGHSPTNLATFYGGGTFALAFAFMRFIYAE